MDKINNNYALFQPELLKKDKKKSSKSNPDNASSSPKIEKSFQDFLLDETKESSHTVEFEAVDKNQAFENQIEQLLQQIGIQGKILKKRPFLDELNYYKTLVKQFLQTIIENAESVEKKTLWNKFRKEKVAKIHLQVVNRELLELTQLFLESQKDIILIGSKIDKIEGILVDMKT